MPDDFVECPGPFLCLRKVHVVLSTGWLPCSSFGVGICLLAVERISAGENMFPLNPKP